MKLNNPVILANIAGATVFLVLAIICLTISASDGPNSWNLEAAKFFGMIFSALAIATSIALLK